MLAGAGPHDRGPGDDCDFSLRSARALQLTSQFANDGRFRFVGVDDGVNELKKVGA